jgi:hypothetical protein
MPVSSWLAASHHQQKKSLPNLWKTRTGRGAEWRVPWATNTFSRISSQDWPAGFQIFHMLRSHDQPYLSRHQDEPRCELNEHFPLIFCKGGRVSCTNLTSPLFAKLCQSLQRLFRSSSSPISCEASRAGPCEQPYSRGSVPSHGDWTAKFD